MLQARLYEEFGNSLGGELGISWGGALRTVSGGIASGYGYVSAGTNYVVDKTCSLVTDPRVQTAATFAAMYPDPYSQSAAAAVKVGSVACGTLRPPSAPPPPPAQGSSEYVSQSTPAVYSRIVGTYTSAATPTSAPRTPAIPTGSIAAYDPKRGGYRVAVPGPPRLSGLAGLAAAFTEVGVQANLPPTARLVSLKTFDEETGAAKPWYKKPLVLAGIGAGVLALGAGAVVLKRR